MSMCGSILMQSGFHRQLLVIVPHIYDSSSIYVIFYIKFVQAPSR